MPIDIFINHIPVINYSMQQNHVSVIRDITLINTGPCDLENITLTVTFDPAFAEPVSQQIAYAGVGSIIRIDDLPVIISTSFLSGLTERINGSIKVSVDDGNGNVTSSTGEISLLAFDQWGGLKVLPAMLSSFVTPNHPEIVPILHRASEILGKWTDSPALDAYQTRDPYRVKMQMAALYEAIAELKITYCNVPASFEDFGQRVRLYSDILSGRLANCLDMTLLYAGCLEAIGINPIIVVIQGHAFAGGWLIDDSFPDSVNDDASLLTKRTADGINEILLVETTCMNSGNDTTFDDAARVADESLKTDDDFLLFIDVRRARHTPIRPLPLRVLRDGVLVISDSETTPAAERCSDAPAALAATDTLRDVQHITFNKQTIWERKLLDLSLRNALLNTRITRNTLQLISADINRLEDALAEGKEFQIQPWPTDWDNDLMSTTLFRKFNDAHPIMEMARAELSQQRLRSYLDKYTLPAVMTHLYRSSRLSLEENGANTLFLAIGMLRWFETPASTLPRYAPVILMPIEIIRKSATKGYVIRSRDEESMINITLLEMLRQDFGIVLDGLDPLPRDESGVDVQKIFNYIRRLIMSRDGWDIEEQALIGIFSFSKFIMWNDIHNNADKLKRNRIVASLLSGKLQWDCSDESEHAGGDLDEAYPVGDVALPIGADSSQFEAICAAVSDKSFILHGPPGTGKSQTITNIIANALYNGKKVLFVAEKMAALQVVKHRLETIGLAPFCLELHSNKSKKSNVLEQLKRTTEVIRRAQDEAFALRARQLGELRSELNGYVRALHRIYPAGLSLYDCFSGYAGSTYGGPLVDLSQQTIAEATPASRADAEIAIAEYRAISIICGPMSAHPLAGIGLKNYTSSLKTDSRRLLTDLAAELKAFIAAMPDLEALIGYSITDLDGDRQSAAIGLAETLLNARHLPCTLPEAAARQTTLSLIERTIARGRERDAARSQLLDSLTDAVLTWDYLPWKQKWSKGSASWWLPRTLASMSVKSRIRKFGRTGLRLTADDVERIFTLLDTYTSRQKELEKAAGELAPVLDHLWDTDCADWDAIESALATTREMNRHAMAMTRDAADTRRVMKAIAANLECGIEAFHDICDGRLNRFASLGQSVRDRREATERMLDTGSLAAMNARDLQLKATRWSENTAMLHDLATYNVLRLRVAQLGYAEIAEAVESGSISPADVTDCFAKSFYRSYAEHILAHEPDLNMFHGTLFDEKMERFRQLSAEFQRLTREELFAKLSASLPALQKEAAQNSEVGILQRNIRNGGRGTSIRRLFDQIPDLLTRMCPCWLMSPISVAQYIDPANTPFDLVIFDEASQMPTSEAVGAIARGRNMIVVGDPKQMPPTTFFTANTFDESNADVEDLENILEDCLALNMPSRHLLWHYRSRHESLIAFSNAKYYENRLLTFPSPDDQTTKVSLQHVDGVYERGRTRQNRAEAEAVTEEIRKRLSSPATRRQSIGVVTFNSNQQSLIEDLLNDMFRQNPQLEAAAMDCDEPIFVKNLENVQGDERDVILFSIGYGPDRTGTVTLNFGPLNRDGGRRRLNVAVSRARYEMKVFSTLTSEQIDLNRTSAEGVADLKAFLEYAEKGRDFIADPSADSHRTTDNIVESLAAELRDRGYSVRTNIGCSGYRIDLAIVDGLRPDRYLLGVLCDGYHFHATKTANDRIVTQDAVLRQLGWRICRMWAMDWWDNREKQIADIVAAIEDARNCPCDEASDETADSLPTEPESAPQPADDSAAAQPAVEADPRRIAYRKCELPVETMTADEFTSGRHDSTIIDRLSAMVACEAPVSKSLLCRRIINSFGITRMGTRISAYMDRLLAQTGLQATGSDSLFYWNTDQNPETYMCVRAESDREPLDIAPEETAAAICIILEEQGAQPLESLMREVAHEFGYNRLGDNVIASIRRGIDHAESLKRIEIQDNRVKLSY